MGLKQPLYSLLAILLLHSTTSKFPPTQSFSQSGDPHHLADHSGSLAEITQHPPHSVNHLLTDVETTCAEGWHHLDGKCFRAFPPSLERSWPQALGHCAKYGAHLAQINSAKENKFVAALVGRHRREATTSHDYWIGLLSHPRSSDDAQSLSYLWSNGRPASRYAGFWAVGEPNERNGSCTKLSTSSGQWSLDMCQALRPFVCEQLACVKGSFHCLGGNCVPGRLHCNGVDDCGDASDEFNCPAARQGEISCLRHERGEEGTLQSPNWPSNYPANAHCIWLIEATVGMRMQLEFNELLQIEPEQDWLIIEDGGPSPNASVVLTQLTGQPSKSQLSWLSSSNYLRVRFRSDASVQAKGFQANWHSVPFKCGGDLKAQTYSQLLQSPDFPKKSGSPAGVECVWRLETGKGDLISLLIDELQLGEKAYLTIHDGPHPSKPILARLEPGPLVTQRLIVSSGGALYVHYYSGAGGKGFSMSYHKGCENRLRPTIGHNYGVVVSPGNAQSPYPPSQLCKWTLEVPAQRDNTSSSPTMTLVLNGFDVAADDSLQIWDGGEVEEPSVGGRARHPDGGFNAKSPEGRPPKVLHAMADRVHLIFATNSVRSGLGWNITYSANCPKLVVPQHVSVSSESTAYGSKVKIACDRGYEFTTGRGRHYEMECGLGGNWSDSAQLPRCQPVYCHPVPQIANGIAVSASNVSYRGAAKYKCRDGFHFADDNGGGEKATEEIHCTDEGNWTQLPQCRAATCAALPSFGNGERRLKYGDGIGYGTVYEYKCNSGYSLHGPSTLLCQASGHWSSPNQPQCRRVRCQEIPKVLNGKVTYLNSTSATTTTPMQPLSFGDIARVECSPGYRAKDPVEIRCLANQSLSTPPQCVDVDECGEQLANCQPKSTKCVNLPGGYQCRCQPGYKPQLGCVKAAPLALAGLPKISSSHNDDQPVSANAVWCASEEDPAPYIILQFAAPKIVERLRLERIPLQAHVPSSSNASSVGYPSLIRVSYSNYTGAPFTLFHPHAETEGGIGKIPKEKANNHTDYGAITLTTLAVAGSEIVPLPNGGIEATAVKVEILGFSGGKLPCVKVEAMGCQKSACSDINECDSLNGGCDHQCFNLDGAYRCSCHDGYDLYVDGERNAKTNDVAVKNDSLRPNHSCIAKQCPPLKAPQNGKALNNETGGHYQYPNIVEFRCEFAYQMRGPSHLKCLADGTWNGTVPFCIAATCAGVKNNSAIGLFVQPDSATIPYGGNVSITCSQQDRPARHSPLASHRQCIYDPRTDGVEYWLSGGDVDCPLVECGAPPALSGAYYEGEDRNFHAGTSFVFHCRQPYQLVGRSSYDDRLVRCNVDGQWDLGDLRCEGPVCVDPGHPDDGQTHLTSVEESAVARFTCNREGYKPFPSDAINCTLGTACVLSEDVGISSGFIPDSAFADNGDTTIFGYETHRARMSSTGWCGSKDAFIFLSVDLQRIYTLTSLRLAGVGGSGHLRGHVTKLQLFYKVQFALNYDNYPVEFHSASGNHNRPYVFQLNPPLRARYILLGITEYESNPCLRFDMQGCLAPLSAAHEIPSHMQVGWNASVPQCMDAQPPVYRNCPTNPVYVQVDDQGQLLPANYSIPDADDNTGYVAYMTVNPEHFEPPQPISQDTDVVYTAFDEAGNSAECIVRLRIPDNQPPVMKCPESYSLWAGENETERVVHFNATSVNLVVQDMSNITETLYSPTSTKLRLYSHVTVEVQVTDAHSNRNKCQFQVALMPEPCSPHSLPIHTASTERKCSKHPGGTICEVKCRQGYRRVVGEEQEIESYSCSADGNWSPKQAPSACVPIGREPARYELKVAVTYTIDGAMSIDDSCLKGYEYLAEANFDTIDMVLSQRCSSSVQVLVRFLSVKFQRVSWKPESRLLRANYTIQVLPTVLEPVFYELCGLTLKTIFDLKIPGATAPIKSLLAMNGHSVATLPAGCPSLNATGSQLSQGFECSQGEVLTWPTIPHSDAVDDSSPPSKGLPQCLACPRGTAFSNNTCEHCPVGSYQDEEGRLVCKTCPEGSHTLVTGVYSPNESCLAVCGNGMFSESGMIPCQLCPRHTFAGPPAIGGYKECEACASDTYTAKLGSTGPSACKPPCKVGHFSVSGLEPCSPCPVNFYQPNVGQQRCMQCPNDTLTREMGRWAENQCRHIDCTSMKCQNRGTCVVRNHRELCECKPGYRGRFCEETVPLCDANPCLNAGKCELAKGSFHCTCAQNYTGSRCQFGPDDCIGMQCPNGGVCQDLPGVGTTKCVCRTGFTGADCSEIADPCQGGEKGANPCRNGADCLPMQLGRYKCRCLPGWTGHNCDKNIDDCADSPCALGAKCHDLVNDFECECPHGFTGKRCQLKDDLCEPNPCLNGGMCVDTLFDRQCICRPGWNGTFCDENIDECASAPCKNGGVCRDKENGYECECLVGYEGSQCQHQVDHCGTEGGHGQQSPCRNGARCVNRGPKYQCDCPAGFEGVHCEHNIDECNSLNITGGVESSCHANGTELCEDLIDGYQCHCRPGWSGTRCQYHHNQCELDNPCENNATCIDTVPGVPKCECQKGWRGERCSEPISQCSAPSNSGGRGPKGEGPCQNGGKCVSLVDDYYCVCPEGVNGKNCEVAPNRCLGEPCLNGGVCGDFGSHLECTCPKGFTGDGCQFRVDVCHSANATCLNGGACSPDGEHSYKCTCQPGFTGHDCEVNVDECASSPCPQAAVCVDQVNAYHCQCPFNMTGAGCEKRIDPDYDLHFYDAPHGQPAHAQQSVPFPLKSSGFSLSVWVRYDVNAKSAAPFLTLYHSQSPNYAVNLTELLQITGEHIKLSLFPASNSSKPVVLHFPARQRPSDGQWNNLVLTWSAHEGAYSVVWNAIRLHTEKGYGEGRPLDINGWMVLGDPLDDEPSTSSSHGQRFIGSITRVNVWSRVLDFEHDIPSIVHRCHGQPPIYEGLALRFANYDHLSGKVERVAKSTCGRTPALHSHAYSADYGAHHLHVDNRPSDMQVASPLREVNVSWQEPVFSSLQPERYPLDRVEQNLKSGQRLTWGEYSVLYVAYDNESNSLECAFTVRVGREFCPDLAPPVNGKQQCETWGPSRRYKACSIHCNDGHSFSRPVAVYYTCAADGQWRPRDGEEDEDAERNSMVIPLFRYPQCTRATTAENIATISLNYPSLQLCTETGKAALRERLQQKIVQLNAKRGICAGMNNTASSETCQGLEIEVECAEEGGDSSGQRGQSRSDKGAEFLVSRHKRAQPQSSTSKSSPQPVFQVTMRLPVSRKVQRHDEDGHKEEGVVVDPVEMIQNEVLFGDLFNLEQVLPNGRPDLNSFHISYKWKCSAVGHWVAPGGVCAPCSPGSYYREDEEACRLCPRGKFQPGQAQLSCFECPPTAPITQSMGSIFSNDCEVKCDAGHYLNLASNKCEPCGFGFYQPNAGSFECIPCGVGKTTLEAMSTSEEECRDECPDGEQLTKAGSCQPCPMGTFRSRGEDKRCVECPDGTTTEGVGAVLSGGCNTPKCMPGQYLVAVDKQCHSCPRGAYQDQELQTSCKVCPPESTTAAEGATRESQCYSTNQCKLGQDNCSWKATCHDLPDVDDVPSFKCICNPGYRGNGTHCVDACTNYCLNDGVCRKSPTGQVECSCKENFSGERCEIRFQPRSQRVALIAGGIAGIVLLLLLIVVVIWMISFRFSSRRDDFGFPSVGGLGGSGGVGLFGIEDAKESPPLTSNFLYASRPAVLPRPESATGSIRPIGYYYEDDPPYGECQAQPRVDSGGSIVGGSSEMKSIFLGPDTSTTTNGGFEEVTASANGGKDGPLVNGLSGGSSRDTQASSGASGGRLIDGAYSASRELEHRLQRVQQHMYLPGGSAAN